jgi:hypothetical protein
MMVMIRRSVMSSARGGSVAKLLFGRHPKVAVGGQSLVETVGGWMSSTDDKSRRSGGRRRCTVQDKFFSADKRYTNMYQRAKYTFREGETVELGVGRPAAVVASLVAGM